MSIGWILSMEMKIHYDTCFAYEIEMIRICLNTCLTCDMGVEIALPIVGS